MNGVPPVGYSSSASRPSADRFASHSENDVAQAFADLLRSDSPSPAASSDSSQRRSAERSESSSSRPSDDDASTRSPRSSESPDAQRGEKDDRRDEERTDDRIESNATVVAQSQANASPAEDADASGASVIESAGESDGEYDSLLADVESLRRALGESGIENGVGAESGDGEVDGEAIASPYAAVADLPEVAVDPVAESSPKIVTPGRDVEDSEPSRRGGTSTDGDEGGIDIEQLTDVATDREAEPDAGLVAAVQRAVDGPSTSDAAADRSAEPKRSRARSEASASASVAAADDAAVSGPTSDVPALSVAAISESTSSPPVAPAGDASATISTTGSSARDGFAENSLRSLNGSREAPPPPLSGADRGRFLDRVERAFQVAERGDGSIRMRLHPAELGVVQLTLERGEGGAWIARIEAESPQAKQALLEHAGALKDRLAEQDFRLSQFEVDTPDDRRQREERDFRENPQSFSRDRERRDDERASEERAGEVTLRADSPTDGSRRLDVTV